MPSLVCSRDGCANPIQALLCSQCGQRLSRVEVGRLFVDRYLVKAALNESASGFCYLAQLASSAKDCILREIIPSVAGQREQLICFTRAAQYLMKTRPSCLAPVLEYFSHRSCYYSVEGRVEGESVQQIIEKSGPFSETRADVLFDSMLAGLKQLYSLDPPIYLGGLKIEQVRCHGENTVFFADSCYLSDSVIQPATRNSATVLAEDLRGVSQITLLALTGGSGSEQQNMAASLSLKSLSLACTLDWLLNLQPGVPDLLAKVDQFQELVTKAESEMNLGHDAEAAALLRRSHLISHSHRIKEEFDKLERPARTVSASERAPQSTVASIRQAPKAEAQIQERPSPEPKEIPFPKPIPLPPSTIEKSGHTKGVEELPKLDSGQARKIAVLPKTIPEAQPQRQSSPAPREASLVEPKLLPTTASVLPPTRPEEPPSQQPPPTLKETTLFKPAAQSASPSALLTKPEVQLQELPLPQQSKAVSKETPPIDQVSRPAGTTIQPQSGSYRPFLVANKKMWLLLTAIAIVGSSIFVGIWISSSLLRHFNAAIQHGYLFSPPEENAYGLYKAAVASDDPGSSRLRQMKNKAQPLVQHFSENKFNEFRRNSYLSVSDWDDLAKAQEWLAAMAPSDPSTLASKEFTDAEVDIAHHRPSEALSGFQRALQQRSDWDLALLGFGSSCFELKRFACADEYYTRANQQNPNWIGPHRALMELYRAQGDTNRACAEYRDFINYSSRMDPPPSDLEPIKGRMENFCNDHAK